MTLAISAIRHGDEQLSDPKLIVLSNRESTIGRGQDCDIVLEDPSRQISRIHVVITREGDSYRLSVQSRINPIYLNGNAVAAGQDARLAGGDSLVIGSYEFSVSDAALTAAAADAVLPFGTGGGDLEALFGATPAPAPMRDARIDDLIGEPGESQQASDPLLDLLGRSDVFGSGSNAPHRTSDSDPLAGIFGNEPGNASFSDHGGLRHLGTSEFSIDNLLGPSPGLSADPLGLSQDVHESSLADQFGGGRGGSLELDHVHAVNLPLPSTDARAMPIPESNANRDPVHPISPRPAFGSAPAQSNGRQPAIVDSDPLAALFSDASASGEMKDPLGLIGGLPAAPASFDTPELPKARMPTASSAAQQSAPGIDPIDVRGRQVDDEIFSQHTSIVAPGEPPTPDLSAAEVRQGAPVSVVGVESNTTEMAIRAFLTGTGVAGVDVPAGNEEAMLRECGATVRAAIEGLMSLLQARAKVKEELQASDRTMVASRANNALKFTENSEEALRFVIDPRSRTDAFLAPHEAVADACADLKAHEFALVAGMRAALIDAVRRFKPNLIEQRLEKTGGRSLLANRKALLWDCFVAYHEQTEREAEDHFERVFGDAFLKAYHDQVQRCGR